MMGVKGSTRVWQRLWLEAVAAHVGRDQPALGGFPVGGVAHAGGGAALQVAHQLGQAVVLQTRPVLGLHPATAVSSMLSSCSWAQASGDFGGAEIFMSACS